MAKKNSERSRAEDYDSNFLRTMGGESDRGCLLVGMSEIDYALGSLLSFWLSQKGKTADAAWLLDSAGGNRPLATLAVRTRLAACLGLIDDDVRALLDGLRRTRNDHAHGTAEFVITDKIVKRALINCSDILRDHLAKAAQIVTWPPNFQEPSDAKKLLVTAILFAAVGISKKYFDLSIAASRRRIRQSSRKNKRKQ